MDLSPEPPPYATLSNLQPQTVIKEKEEARKDDFCRSGAILGCIAPPPFQMRVEILTPVPHAMTVFGERAFKNIIRLTRVVPTPV